MYAGNGTGVHQSLTRTCKPIQRNSKEGGWAPGQPSSQILIRVLPRLEDGEICPPETVSFLS